MAEDPLYFIGIIPPEFIRSEITGIKKYIEAKYGARHALKSPPHITLIPPFRWPQSGENQLIQGLDDFSGRENKFPLYLEGYGAFPPRVIYVNVIPNENLFQLHKKILEYFKDTFKLPGSGTKRNSFSPHVTVAFKDLQKKDFTDAWTEFRDKKINFNFLAEGLIIFKHNGKFWEIFYSTVFIDK